MIVPCIEISRGRALHVDSVREEGALPGELLGIAEALARSGEITVFDRDAEDGTGDSIDLVREVCAQMPCSIGGGIRSQDRGRALLRAGAERIIVRWDAGEDLMKAFRPEHLIVSVDASETGQVGDGEMEQVLRSCEKMCRAFLVENPPLDGQTGKPDLEWIRRLSMLTDRRVTVVADSLGPGAVARLDRMGVNVQSCEALLTGRLDVAEAYSACIEWDDDGLAPTIVQDHAGQVLMLASSSRESLEIAVRSGEGTYHSVERGGVWRKGERSGHDQLVLRCVPSWDRRSLLFVVKQAGVACENGSYSWYGERDFSLQLLSEITAAKKSGDPGTSYTARLLNDPAVLRARLGEKMRELFDADERDEVNWAVADLVYFLVVRVASEGLTWSDVVRELRGRQR